ncbi:TPA: AbrB/MazE/SpoVT family DNA-binding domain-containing protein [Candidatus Micrarchaeota archaeon]|nr:AbrB/MazE/SpoVT family DNA-binding domain-containing protein [Candidatus Micrarchaeota archaeon]
MEFVESGLTSKFQLTLPKTVRETLGVKEHDEVVFLIENRNVKLIKKPGDILKAMESLSEGRRFSAKEIREEIQRDRKRW